MSFAGRAQATTLTTWLREDDDAAPDGTLRHAADGVKGYQREGHRRRQVQTNARHVNGRRGFFSRGSCAQHGCQYIPAAIRQAEAAARNDAAGLPMLGLNAGFHALLNSAEGV